MIMYSLNKTLYYRNIMLIIACIHPYSETDLNVPGISGNCKQIFSGNCNVRGGGLDIMRGHI